MSSGRKHNWIILNSKSKQIDKKKEEEGKDKAKLVKMESRRHKKQT